MYIFYAFRSDRHTYRQTNRQTDIYLCLKATPETNKLSISRVLLMYMYYEPLRLSPHFNEKRYIVDL